MTETVETLKAKACEITGLNDFGDAWFEQPLAAWAKDLGGPFLSDSGRRFLARLAVTNLCRRLEVIDWWTRHPEIDDVPIPAILYITGLERSGTTFLHNLLALHPAARPLLRWELMRPAPPPEANSYLTDPRIAEVQASADRLRGTLLEQMHWVNADDPEECTWAALDCTGLLGRSAILFMPTWGRWIAQNDLTPSFLEYRRLIKLLLWRNPLNSGGHLVLKSPQNSRNVGQFSAAFPEASFVFTHRDPFRICTSSCTMLEHSTASLTSQEDFWRPEGPGVTETIRHLELGLTRMTAFDDAPGARVTHAAYPALMADPASAIRRIYEQLRFDSPRNLADRIASFIAAQSAGKRAPAPKSLPTYGLDHETFLSRPVIATYMRRFAVEPETVRMTGA
ncbi:MAG: sulfotransferase [Caulobacter sp.]|nr:sulfotransferase [Caulobacter sp.]